MPTSRRRSSRPTHTRRGAAPDFGRRLRAPRIVPGPHGGDSRPDEDLRSSSMMRANPFRDWRSTLAFEALACEDSGCRRLMTDPIQPWPVVRRGANGHPVRTLQHLLRAHGQQVSVDGVFGPLTEAAVKAVQTASGLTADGIVGPQTWPRLIVQVRRGDRGEAVRGVQEEFQFRNLSGDPSQGRADRRDLRAKDGRGGARLPAGARLERRRDRRAAHLAGARQRHAGRMRRPPPVAPTLISTDAVIGQEEQGCGGAATGSEDDE